MEDHFRKKSSAPPDMPSPVLLRRRLSAPETIMRKHMLAQQRSDSQDSDITQTSDVRSCQWRIEKGIGSDPNLSKRRDPGFMRKSTLMRRFWGSNKPLSERSSNLSGSYYDWQYSKLSRGRSIQSLGSTHSSPEHVKPRNVVSLTNDDPTTSSVQEKDENSNKKIYQKNQMIDINKSNNRLNVKDAGKCNPSMLNGNVDVRITPLSSSCSNYTYAANFNNLTSSAEATMKSPSNTTIETESERYSTQSTSRIGTTTFSDNSDSAITNNNSNFSKTSNENSSVCAGTISSVRFIEGNGNDGESENANVKQINHIERNITDNSKTLLDNYNETSTQTTDIANLNIISNVKLSQSTLNLIFSQVMQDVQKSSTSNINISSISSGIPVHSSTVGSVPKTNTIQVQEIPSFYLKQKEEKLAGQHRVLKHMVSNVGTGSSYSKPAEIPQVVVPRFSALPRTTSMEVNTSSGESTDRESDNFSLVDSLEDPSSPRPGINHNLKDVCNSTGENCTPLLPDNSNATANLLKSKASAFFIPIESNTNAKIVPVAYHLPEKLRKRLSKRQFQREQKLKQTKDKLFSPRSDSNYVSASDNGNQIHYVLESHKCTNNSPFSNINIVKNKRKTKPTLPVIRPVRKIKVEDKASVKHSDTIKIRDKKLNKPAKRKITRQPQELSAPESLIHDKRQAQLLSKSTHTLMGRSSSVPSSKSEYSYDLLPRRIYHKTEFNNSNKSIEILEIVECVDAVPSSKMQASKAKKSKIPVLMHSKLPSITKSDKIQRPVFLDFDQVHEMEPKIDQLIANILIDALNKTDAHTSPEDKSKLPSCASITTEKRLQRTQFCQTWHQNSKYRQKFECIPEERTSSLQSSSEEASHAEVLPDLPKKKSDEKAPKEAIESEEKAFSNKKTNGMPPTPKSVILDGFREKAVLGVLKDENYSSIPKGWITFYTVHKSQGSPESTSDEGKKNMGSMNSQLNGKLKEDLQKRNRLNKVAKTDKFVEEKLENLKSRNTPRDWPGSRYENAYVVLNKEIPHSQDNADTWTSSDQEKHYRVLHPLPATTHTLKNQQRNGRHKNLEPANKVMPGWTVTVSGTTSGDQFATDLELRLTFPRGEKQSIVTNQADVGSSQTVQERGRTFPDLVFTKENNHTQCSNKTENSCTRRYLPHIGKHSTKTTRQCESSHLNSVKDYPEPRQTKTSTRRHLLNRPKTLLTPSEFISMDTDNSLKGIIEKFPEILNIAGNAMNPEKKPRVSTMSERDVTRHLYSDT